MAAMNDWADFFLKVDSLPEGEERAEFMALLHRGFAVSYPGAWEGFDSKQRRSDRCRGAGFKYRGGHPDHPSVSGAN